MVEQQYADSKNLRARIRIYELFSTARYGWYQWVFDQLDLPTASRVLEIGCGPGSLWAKNAGRIPEDWRITLSDLSQGMVTEAQQNLEKGRRLFTFAVCGAQCVPFQQQSFDAVIANHMLYHVPSLASALSEIRRVLKPDGHLYATTIGTGHLRELNEVLGRVKPGAAVTTLRSDDGRFSLDPSDNQLGRWFSGVGLRRYEQELLVTDPEPLLDYIQAWSLLDEIQAREFRELVQRKISENGAMHISTDQGMFIALRSRANSREE